MFKSIFAKQFTLYMSVFILSYVVLAIALISSFGDFFVAQKTKMLEEQAKRIATVYKPNVFGQLVFDQYELQSEIEVLHEYNDASFIFVDNANKIIMATTDIAEFTGKYLNLDDFEGLLDGQTKSYIGTVEGVFKSNVLTVAYPVNVGELTVGAVLLSSAMPELEKNSKEMFTITITCLLISAIVAFVLTIYFSRTMSKPLTEMNNAAKIIASGDFEKRITVKSKDEVGQLAQSFNNMAESLFEQENLRKVFITNVSHDLRSPLTSIRGFLQAILDGTIEPEKQNYYLNIVLTETERLAKLTHEIIELNNLQTPEVKLVKSNFDINCLIRTTIQMFETSALRKNIKVNLTFASEQMQVFADYDIVQRIVYNLVDNAVKFSQNGAIITVETTLSGQKVLVSVKDNGCGIKQADQKRIFERFYKVDESRGVDKFGNGLGLSIVASFVKAHEENITLVSELGEGSEFTFSLQLS